MLHADSVRCPRLRILRPCRLWTRSESLESDLRESNPGCIQANKPRLLEACGLPPFGLGRCQFRIYRRAIWLLLRALLVRRRIGSGRRIEHPREGPEQLLVAP